MEKKLAYMVDSSMRIFVLHILCITYKYKLRCLQLIHLHNYIYIVQFTHCLSDSWFGVSVASTLIKVYLIKINKTENVVDGRQTWKAATRKIRVSKCTRLISSARKSTSSTLNYFS